MDMPMDTQQAPTILVDGEPVRAVGDQLSGQEILALAGKEGRALYAEGHHGLRIGPEDVVPVQDGSRFRTMPGA